MGLHGRPSGCGRTEEPCSSDTVRGGLIPARVNDIDNFIRSKSAYRSAAALSALMCLSTTSPTFGKFFFAIAKVEPILYLETHAEALNKSYPEKKLFLALVALGRARIPSKDRDLIQSGSEIVQCLRQDLRKLLDLDQYVLSFILLRARAIDVTFYRTSQCGTILALSNASLLLAKIRRTLEEVIYESDVENISEITYCLFIFALISFDRALNHFGSTEQFGDLVLSICVEWFHELGWSILQWFTKSQHYPLLYKLYSPFVVCVMLIQSLVDRSTDFFAMRM